MTINSQSPAMILRTLKMIHMAMFSSVVIFSGISLYLRNELGMTLEPPTIEMLYYISLISILAFIPLGYWLHGKKMKSIGNHSTLSSKLAAYQSSHITKIALFETSALLSLIVLIVGGKNSIFIQVAIVLIIILLNMPSVHKLSTELSLPPEESNLLLF